MCLPARQTHRLSVSLKIGVSVCFLVDVFLCFSFRLFILGKLLSGSRCNSTYGSLFPVKGVHEYQLVIRPRHGILFLAVHYKKTLQVKTRKQNCMKSSLLLCKYLGKSCKESGNSYHSECFQHLRLPPNAACSLVQEIMQQFSKNPQGHWNHSAGESVLKCLGKI